MILLYIIKEGNQRNVFFIFCARIRGMFEELFKTVMLAKNDQATEIDVCLLYL